MDLHETLNAATCIHVTNIHSIRMIFACFQLFRKHGGDFFLKLPMANTILPVAASKCFIGTGSVPWVKSWAKPILLSITTVFRWEVSSRYYLLQFGVTVIKAVLDPMNVHCFLKKYMTIESRPPTLSLHTYSKYLTVALLVGHSSLQYFGP